jgi:hypothetical protein
MFASSALAIQVRDAAVAAVLLVDKSAICVNLRDASQLGVPDEEEQE